MSGNPSDESCGSVRRRDFLRTAAAGTAVLLADPAVKAAWPAGTHPVVAENARPGTSDWQLTYVRFDAGGRSRSVEGFCSATSVRPGESLDLFLSAAVETRATCDLYRLGYYGGLGGRHVARLGPQPVGPQPEPEVGPNRLRECRWEKWATLAVPTDWPSGVYLGKLATESDRNESYLIFIVRDDRPADLLFQ
ncbi:MAG TPA: N,N-dimethylformamidase beta subunit family domain-containing protein, partial [Planctomycetaceae bacterium]